MAKKKGMDLEEKVEMFLGIGRGAFPANQLYGDGFFYNSIIKDYGKEAYKKVKERVVNKYGKA